MAFWISTDGHFYGVSSFGYHWHWMYLSFDLQYIIIIWTLMSPYLLLTNVWFILIWLLFYLMLFIMRLVYYWVSAFLCYFYPLTETYFYFIFYIFSLELCTGCLYKWDLVPQSKEEDRGKHAHNLTGNVMLKKHVICSSVMMIHGNLVWPQMINVQSPSLMPAIKLLVMLYVLISDADGFLPATASGVVLCCSSKTKIWHPPHLILPHTFMFEIHSFICKPHPLLLAPPLPY